MNKLVRLKRFVLINLCFYSFDGYTIFLCFTTNYGRHFYAKSKDRTVKKSLFLWLNTKSYTDVTEVSKDLMRVFAALYWQRYKTGLTSEFEWRSAFENLKLFRLEWFNYFRLRFNLYLKLSWEIWIKYVAQIVIFNKKRKLFRVNIDVN